MLMNIIQGEAWEGGEQGEAGGRLQGSYGLNFYSVFSHGLKPDSDFSHGLNFDLDFSHGLNCKSHCRFQSWAKSQVWPQISVMLKIMIRVTDCITVWFGLDTCSIFVSRLITPHFHVAPILTMSCTTSILMICFARGFDVSSSLLSKKKHHHYCPISSSLLSRIIWRLH